LLDIFWKGHDPTRRPWSRQYMAAVFYHDDEQKLSARRSLDRLKSAHDDEIRTQILPASDFYLAEAYHQKYTLRMYSSFLRELTRVYPLPEDLVDSTAAARINGYLAGHSDSARLSEDLPLLGLSRESGLELERIVKDLEKVTPPACR
jgi:hypothetical protein